MKRNGMVLYLCFMMIILSSFTTSGKKNGYEPAQKRTSALVDWENLRFGAFVHFNNSPFKRDVVKMFVDACRKHGIQPCFYYCLWGNDRWNPKNWNPTIKAELEGTSPKKIILAQLSELSENYGKIPEFWLDMQVWADSTLKPQETYDLLKSKNPKWGNK